jgi:putative Mg2+ transporter-C (MgtC) family protein
MRDGLSIRGLSTSATVWATGAIGVLAGYGQLFEATEATLLILLINFISPKLNSALVTFLPAHKPAGRQYSIELKVAETDEAEIRARILAEIESGKLKFRSLERSSIPGTHLIHLTIDLLEDEEVIASLIRQLSLSPNILSCSYKP